MPPGHPIKLLKSNKFNMAAVSVKEVYFTSTALEKCKKRIQYGLKHSQTGTRFLFTEN